MARWLMRSSTSSLDDEMEPEEFWQLANKNLQERNIRLLFVADEIPTELQRIVEFLNEQMVRTKVLAIEIKQFVSEVGGQKALRPRLIGQTARGETVKSPTSVAGKIDERRFFEALTENCSAEEIKAARRLLTWSEKNSSYVKWRSKSFAPYFESDSSYPHIPTSVSMEGKVGINFARMKNSGLPDEKRVEILHRLNAIPGIDLPPGSIGEKIGFPLSTLKDDRSLEQFLNLVAWTVEQVRIAQPPQATNHSAQSALS